MKANVKDKKERIKKELKRVAKEINYLKENIKETYQDDSYHIKWMNANLDATLKTYATLLNFGDMIDKSFVISKLGDLYIEKPLSPIKKDQDIWERFPFYNKKDIKEKYQCTRYSSLFKNVHKDGSISYHDNERVICKDIIFESYFVFGLGNLICDEKFPIKLPYTVGEDLYTVVMHQFLSDPSKKDLADFDTVAVLYIEHETSDGLKDKGIPIYRYFRESNEYEDPTYGSWVEIGLEELEQRIASSKSNLTLEDLGINRITCSDQFEQMEKNNAKSENLNQFLSDAT